MRKYITVLLFIISFQLSFSQGVIFDSAQFASRKSIKITRGYLPAAYSLKQYTPIIYPQVGSTCVAHSFAAARTILAAKSLGWTDKKKITSLYFSPYYIYFRNKNEADVGCSIGLELEATAKDVLQNGFAPIADVEYPYYYPFTKSVLCVDKNGTSYPPTMAEDAAEAAKYKIDEIYTITTVQQLKTALSSGMPVVIVLYPPSSFNYAKGSDLWTPYTTERVNINVLAHAVVAIGYNDNKYGGSIEIMNSWGDTWGNQGFINIKYSDYLKWFVGGYAFYVKDNKMQTNPYEKTNSPKTNPYSNSSSTRKSIDNNATRESIYPTNISIRRGYGNAVTKFNNAKILKAFKK
jgi:hypothetical protein